MVEVAEERGERGLEVRHQNSLFYAINGMVALLDPQWLQGSFSTLLGLFCRVVLQTNVGKIVGRVCRPFQAAGTLSESAYGRRMKGEEPSYWGRQKRRVRCMECGEDMADGLVAGHMKIQHWQVAEERWSWTTLATGGKPQTYRMEFLFKGGPRSCPDEGCQVQVVTRTKMRVHFLHRHVQDTVVIF